MRPLVVLTLSLALVHAWAAPARCQMTVYIDMNLDEIPDVNLYPDDHQKKFLEVDLQKQIKQELEDKLPSAWSFQFAKGKYPLLSIRFSVDAASVSMEFGVKSEEHTQPKGLCVNGGMTVDIGTRGDFDNHSRTAEALGRFLGDRFRHHLGTYLDVCTRRFHDFVPVCTVAQFDADKGGARIPFALEEFARWHYKIDYSAPGGPFAVYADGQEEIWTDGVGKKWLIVKFRQWEKGGAAREPIPLDNADVKKLFSELTTIVHRVYLQFQ
jgi:hypothetical protein